MKPDSLIIETLERILEDLCGPSVVNDAQTGQWPAALWEQLESAGLPLTWVDEGHAGAGACGMGSGSGGSPRGAGSVSGGGGRRHPPDLPPRQKTLFFQAARKNAARKTPTKLLRHL